MTASIQTTFSDSPAIGVEGQLARTSPNTEVQGRVCGSRKLLSIAITAVNSHVYAPTINGTAFSYTADGSATTAEIALALVAAINAGTEPVHASGTDTPILIESTRDSDFNADFGDTSPANARLTGDFVFVGETNLVATTLVAQGQEIPTGVGVCMDERSSDAQAARLPRQSADVTGFRFAGVVLNDIAKTAYVVGAKQTFHRNTMLPVLGEGYVFVKVEQDVSKGDQAFCRFAVGSGGSQLGAFRKDADTASAAACAKCFYEVGASSGGLAVLKVSR